MVCQALREDLGPYLPRVELLAGEREGEREREREGGEGEQGG